jgi:hypothetical protein
MLLGRGGRGGGGPGRLVKGTVGGFSGMGKLEFFMRIGREMDLPWTRVVLDEDEVLRPRRLGLVTDKAGFKLPSSSQVLGASYSTGICGTGGGGGDPEPRLLLPNKREPGKS